MESEEEEMTLEESKGILSSVSIDDYGWGLSEHGAKKVTEAIDTILKALEDSIPKEKVRELLDEQYELYNSKDQAKTDFSRMYTLEELLGE